MALVILLLDTKCMWHAIWQEAFTTIQPMNYTCQADNNKRAQLSAANLQFQGRGQLYLRLYLSKTFMSSTILEAAPACLHCIFISKTRKGCLKRKTYGLCQCTI